MWPGKCGRHVSSDGCSSLSGAPVPWASWRVGLVKKLGIDAIEKVLLYHVVPGGPIMAKDALKADGAKLATGLPGASIKVDVKGMNVPVIILIDRDRNDANPRVNPWQTDINEGNKQIAHGITRVLRPINL